MADVFDQIFGQPGVRDFLRASVAAGRVTQAYLFTGPAGSNKTQAAYALASAILCEKDGCGTCETCERIARRKHPDVHYYAPEGAAGYLVDQIREIVSEVALAPIQATSKVYILDRVDLLGVHAANAFLNCYDISKVYYDGSKFAFDQIVIGSGNDCLLNAMKTLAGIEKKQLLTSLAEPAENFPLSIELIRSGRIDAARVITHRLPMSEYGRLAGLYGQDSPAIKTVILPGA